MSIQVSWGNLEKSYVYIEVIDTWTWQEFHECITSANALIATVTHDVYIVTHLTNAGAQKLPIGAFIQWRRSLNNTPANVKMVIIVAGLPTISLFLDTVQRMFQSIITFKFRVVTTLENAESIIKELQKGNTKIG